MSSSEPPSTGLSGVSDAVFEVNRVAAARSGTHRLESQPGLHAMREESLATLGETREECRKWQHD